MLKRLRRMTGADRSPRQGDVLRSPKQMGAKDEFLFTCIFDGELSSRTPVGRMTYVRRQDGGSVMVEVSKAEE